MSDEVQQYHPLADAEGGQAWLDAAISIDATAPFDEAAFALMSRASEDIVDGLIEAQAHSRALEKHPLAREVAALRALGELCAGVSQMVRTRPEGDPSSLTMSLLMLNAMARQRVYEAEVLIVAHLGEGALIVARTLYETSTKEVLLRRFHGTDGCENLADQYLSSAMVETRGNARTHEETWGKDGYPYSPEGLARAEALAAEAIARATSQGNPSLAKTNGWAAPVTGGNPPSLLRMAELADVSDHQLAYKHASHLVHANAYAAIQHREPAGGPDVYGLDGQRSFGAATLAGQYAALGLGRTCEALSGTFRTPLEVPVLKVLRHLASRVHVMFHDAGAEHIKETVASA